MTFACGFAAGGRRGGVCTVVIRGRLHGGVLLWAPQRIFNCTFPRLYFALFYAYFKNKTCEHARIANTTNESRQGKPEHKQKQNMLSYTHDIGSAERVFVFPPVAACGLINIDNQINIVYCIIC